MHNKQELTDSKIKEIENKFISELKEYYSIKDKYGKNWMDDNTKEIYIINKEWLKYWKEYINKNYLTYKYKLRSIPSNKKGEIPNEFK